MNSDLLFRNGSDNGTQIWMMDGNRINSRVTLLSEDGKTPMSVGPPWSIVGIGDFNKNGGADILFVNSVTGQTQVWLMDGNRIIRRVPLMSEDGKTEMSVGPPFTIVGIGDFDKNGGADILFRNTADNGTQIWLMDGNRISRRVPLLSEDNKTPMFVGPPFTIVGIGDFDKNGGADILFRNTTDNGTQIWLMDGNRISRRVPLLSEDGKTPMFVGPPFEIVGIGDFNKNGGADILFRNTSDNGTQIWLMDGNRISRRVPLLSEDNKTSMFIGAPFSVVGVGDFDPLPKPKLEPAVTVRTFDAIDSDNGTTQLASNLALGGSAHLLVTNTGAFTLTFHAHDSGFDNIDYSVAAVLMAKSGLAFTFEHQGGVEGTSAGLPFGTPRRDDNVTLAGTNPALKDSFDQLGGATLVAKLAGTDTLVKGIEGLIGDALSSAAKELGAAAGKAVIALVA